MRQDIAGVSPAQVAETTVTTTWPSIAVYPTGRKLGTWFEIAWPDIYFFRLGNLLALLSIPVALLLYFLRLLPGRGVRYRLTNRRVVVESALTYTEQGSLGLGDFDTITIEVQPGQAWFHAGDLVFLQHGQPVFRLDGVSRPEVFRQTCDKSRKTWQGVQLVAQPA